MTCRNFRSCFDEMYPLFVVFSMKEQKKEPASTVGSISSFR